MYRQHHGRARLQSCLLAPLVLALAACGGGGSDSSPAPAATPVLAADDTLTLVAGNSGLVLTNDTLGGAPATVGASGNVLFNVTSTSLPAGVTLVDGVLNIAAAALPGSSNITYRICQASATSNCASGTLHLTIAPTPLVAAADNFNLLPGASGDVLINDTLGGAAAAAGQVVATVVGSLPSGLSLSAGGVLAVATGTTAGTYAVNYQICQATVPSNCATATATAVVPSVGTVSGRAIDANTGAGVAGVTVSVGGVQTTTDTSGSFSVSGLAAADRQAVVFTSTTHAETVRVTAVRTGSSTDVQARLQPVGASAAVDVAAGGSVAVTGSTARVTLPADGVQRSDGSVPSGNMTVRLTAINPGVDSTLMPGDFTTVVSGVAAPIESFGAINVALTDSAGAALNLRSGRSAVIRIPVGSRNATPPSTIPLFFVDNASGRWVQEGTATLVGSGTSAYYEGTVTHFSTWNADQVYNTVRITGCVANAAGLPVSGAQVVSDGVDYSGTSGAITDATGQFVLSMRKASTATLVAVSNGLLTNTLRVGPYSGDTSLSGCLALGQTGAGVTMKLTWGLAPRDLDSHIVTPSGTEVYFGSKGNLLLAPFTNLDVDDTSSYGPEVVTLTKLMVGTYKYWVHNYSGFSAGSITASGARVELNVPGRSLELFVPPTTGETASTPVWNLFELDVDAQCRVTVRRTGTFSNAAPARTSGTPVYCTAP